mmetsp:Transcript_98990/g.255936  ORF Transcript_98990/g.255936 Transcript_98990/m.255936 type:complete len:201 (+) Transcript_98990:1229-1831(+)
MSAALRFHSVTIPLRSTPKIGALAVSIRRDRSSATRSCSLVISRISVISCPTPITPVTSPSGPRLVVALSRIIRRSPSFVKSGNSKLAVSLPFSAASRTSLTETLNSSVMKFATRDFPIASRLEKPSKAEALAFHSETLPSVSMPKIGAFAVSMRRMRSSATRLDSAITWFSVVMSCPTAIAPMMLPCASRLAVAFISTV